MANNVRLVRAEFETAVKYLTKEGFVNSFPITFEYSKEEYIVVQVGFKIIEPTEYVVEMVQGIPTVKFTSDLPVGVYVTLRSRSDSTGVPHTYHYTGNAKGQSEFNQKTMDENFEYLDRIVEEVNDSAALTMDSLAGFEDSFDNVLDRTDEIERIANAANAKSESAIATANRADIKADGAIATATQALDTAKAADIKSDQAVIVADAAKGISDEAISTAGEANNTASNALTEATKATGIASLAEANSNEATEVAGEAKDIAEGIGGKATEALAKSEEAKAEVSVATTTANEAKDIAQGIEAKADSAIEIAGEADVKAQEALDKATASGMSESELISKSEGTGKWLREGAYGLGGTRVFEIPENPNECQPCGFYYGTNLSSGGAFFIDHLFSKNRAGFRISNAPYSDKFYMQGSASGNSRLFRPAVELYHDKNTTTDKNGVLHTGTRTPINTLNVSDMSDTVVDRDDVTVTSGAVFRGLAKKWDIQTTTGTGNIARMSEVQKKADITYVDTSLDTTLLKTDVANEWGDNPDKVLSQGFLSSEYNKLDYKKFDKSDITDVVTQGRNTVPSNSAIYSLIQDGIVVTPEALPADLTSSVYNFIDFYAGASPETDSLNRVITYKGNKDLDQVNLGYGLMAEGSNFTLGYPLLDSSKPSQIVSISFYVSETQDVKQAVILQQLGAGRLDITLEGYALVNRGRVGGVYINGTWNLFEYDYNVSNNLTLYTDGSGDLEVYLNGVLSFVVSEAVKPSGTSTNLLLQSRTNSYTYLHEIREVSTRVNKSTLYDLIGRVRLKLGIPHSLKLPISNSALLFTPSAMIVDSAGNVIYSLNSETVISPASIVKVLTCDIALNILDINEVLTVSSGDIRQDSLLVEGDNISTLDAVKAAMLLSSNTSATLLARSAGEKLGGGLNDFLQMMELTAKSYGMKHTNFVNANGIYNPNQMTTVKDMCILGLKSRRNLLLTTVMSTVEDIIYINGTPNSITSTVSNIGVNGIVSGKTGTISSPTVGTFNVLNYVSHDAKDYVICVLNEPSAVTRFSTANLLSKSLGDAINNL